MRDILGRSREANHQIKTRNQKQGAGKNRGRAKTKGSRQSESLMYAQKELGIADDHFQTMCDSETWI